MTGRIKLDKVTDGIRAKQHDMKGLFGNRLIEHNRPSKDENMNDAIQADGAQYRGSGNEASWRYRKN